MKITPVLRLITVCATHTALRPLVALLGISCVLTSSLLANPQSPQVVRGQATIQQSGSTLTVTNTPGAIINWQQFNINRGELTQFVQQSAASQVLNRVVGVDPSVILGKLQSNGRVFLINPNGIVFGAGSQVDVGGLVASTLQLSNDDFINNRLRFTDTPGAGAISNAGTIRSATGGEVLLIAPRVENSGLIFAPEGKILLAAGRTVEVADIDRPSIRVEITNTAEEAVNVGTLMAREISIYGGLVRNSGTIQATSAVMGQNGKIILRAAQRVVLEPTSVLQATGSQGTTGGDISISAQNTQGLAGGGEVLVQGLVTTRPQADLVVFDTAADTSKPLALAVSRQVTATAEANVNTMTPVTTDAAAATDATDGGVSAPTTVVTETTAVPLIPLATLVVPSAPEPPERPIPANPALPVNPAAPNSPTGGTGVGGRIRIGAGGRVDVGDDARIDASGVYGGGEILVGGGWQGLNPNIVNSQFTYIASSATLFANADLRGNGGLVVVWANDSARIYGQVAARGGAQGGDGGYIETSGKRWLDVTRVADASAPMGKGGQWLLDPNNVIIGGTETSISSNTALGTTTLSTTTDSAVIAVSTIEAALNAGINVTITTSAGGLQAGDITVSSAITSTSDTDVTLTLIAHNNININADITAIGGGKLNLTLSSVLPTLDNNAKLSLNSGLVSSPVGMLWMNSGTLENVTFSGSANLLGTVNAYGTISMLASGFSGPGTLFIPTGRVLTMKGFGITGMGAISNQGLLQLDLDAGGSMGISLINSGILDFVGASTTLVCMPSCTNTGTIRTTGTGTMTISAGLTSTDGSYEASGAGNLNLVGGSYSGTTTIIGDKVLAFATSFADGSVIDGDFNMTIGGVVTLGNATIIGSANFSNANVSLTSGTTTTVAAGGNLNFRSGGAVSGGGMLVNEGTTTFNNNGTDISFVNRGSMTMNGSNVFVGTGATYTQESGTLNLSATNAFTVGNFNWTGGTLAGISSGLGPTAVPVFTGSGTRVLNGVNMSVNNLTLPGGSLAVQSGNLTLSGTTSVPVGTSLTLNGGALTNNGVMNVNGSVVLNGGAFTNNAAITTFGSGSFGAPANNTVTWGGTGSIASTGVLNLSGQTITNAITNQGTINLGTGLIFTQLFTNTGTVVAQSGTTTQFNGGFTQTSGSLQLNNGNVTGNVTLNGGVLSGAGTINGNLTLGAATLAPGFSPGAITITGNMVLGAASTLTVELGGLAQGSGYDWINVNGSATLGGTLNVTSFGGYIPAAGSTYNVMSYASATGAFATTTQPGGWSLVFTPGANSYQLGMAAALVSDGSANSSGTGSLQDIFDRMIQYDPNARDDQVNPKRLISVEKLIEEEGCP